MSIIIDAYGGVVEVFGRDYFVEDYDGVEELIVDIEQHYTLSRKEKERLKNLDFGRDEEVIDYE